MRFDVITLFPNLFLEHLNNLPFKKAISNKSLEVNLINLKDFCLDNYGTVDDKPYGGGTGMVLRCEPIYNALQSITRLKNSKVIAMAPAGRTYTQNTAINFNNTLDQLIIICGRYEGIDQRILDNYCDEVISIGQYVLSGGELPALVVMESMTRLLEGVLKPEATQIESFSQQSNEIEFPQYTRPEVFNNHKVPEILLSGDHKKIQKWREQQSKTYEI